MSKLLRGLFSKKGLSKKDIREFLNKNGKSRTICYVLITCGEAKADGKMDVEMKYEGDKWLAAYMIESASKIIEGE
jgi:hypothetical protein